MEIPPARQTKPNPPLHRGALIPSPAEHLHIFLNDKPRPAHYLQIGVFCDSHWLTNIDSCFYLAKVLIFIES